MSDLTMKYNPAFLDEETLVRTFVVRHREFAAVMESVRENDGDSNQHVLVIGPRGSGKSTLALRVAAEVKRDDTLQEQWYPVVYGEESYLVTSAGEFWLEALLQIAEQTGEARWREAHDDLLSERSSDRLTRRALAQLLDFADERGVRLLFIVENLHQLVGSQIDDADETWAIRRTLQTEPRIMLLGTATRRFDQIDDQGQALYEFFRIVDLDPLDSLDEIGSLWALAGNTDTPRAFLRPVEILTGGNPRLIRILSEFAAKTSFRDLMENLVHLMDEHTEYFKHHLDKLAPKERKVFVALADRWDPGTARDIAEVARMDVNLVSAQLKRLEERGAVRVVDQRGRTKVYQVAERLYNVYHLMRRRGQASARVRAAVRFMVGFYAGDRLLPAVQALVRETCDLTPDRRANHYLAYSEVLKQTEPDLRARIVAETRDDLYTLPDVPDDLRRQLESNPYKGIPRDQLASVDYASIKDTRELRQLVAAIRSTKPTSQDPALFATLLGATDILLDSEPESTAHWRNRAWALGALGHHDEAIEALDKAIEHGDDKGWTWEQRAWNLGKLKRYPEALDASDEAVKRDSENGWVWVNRGWTLNRLRRYADAIPVLKKALSITPDHPLALHDLGVALERSGQPEEALRTYSHALTLNPKDAHLWGHKGSLLMDQGDFGQAAQAFQRQVSLSPDDPKAVYNVGLVATFLDRHREALDSLDVIARSEHGAPSTAKLTVLALMLAACGEAETTLHTLQASPLASEVEPLIVALRMHLGETVYVAQEIEEVAEDLLASLREIREVKTSEAAP